MRAEGLGGGATSERQGQLTLNQGTHVVVGAAAGEVRDCPYCGATVATADVTCSHCGHAVVLTSLYLRTLVVQRGGSLTVEKGGKVLIGRPGPAPLLSRAAATGDLEQVKARLEQGDDVDATGTQRKTPLIEALEGGHLEVARLLIAMGATLDDADDAGRTPLHVAAERGLEPAVEILLHEGANPRLQTKQGRLASDLAKAAGHEALATRLANL